MAFIGRTEAKFNTDLKFVLNEAREFGWNDLTSAGIELLFLKFGMYLEEKERKNKINDACQLCGKKPAEGLATIQVGPDNDEARYCHGDEGDEETCYMKMTHLVNEMRSIPFPPLTD